MISIVKHYKSGTIQVSLFQYANVSLKEHLHVTPLENEIQEVIVGLAKNFHPSIHLTLKKLIDEKSARDNVKFTACQLANALDMPRSMITKLTHPDKSKRVINPRIDTLLKIIDFFRSDGFNITLEDLIGINTTTVDIAEQEDISEEEYHSIQIYSFSNTREDPIGSFDLNITNWNDRIYGIQSNHDIMPFFKAGSIFVINPELQIEPENLIALVSPDTNDVLIRKYTKDKNKVILKSLDNQEKDIFLMPTTQYEILGVVVQVNAKT